MAKLKRSRTESTRAGYRGSIRVRDFEYARELHCSSIEGIRQAPGTPRRSVDLETILAESEEDLSDRLRRVHASASHIWKHPRLPWYTDHSADRHSRRIIQLLGQLTEDLQAGPEKLTPHELYVLLAAAYLHDIGMQDFRIDGRGPEELGIADYELVRRRHPKRSKELIVNGALLLDAERDSFRIDLDDDPQYLVPIALVSQAHGSSYFAESIEELRRGAYAPGNEPLRGPLLGALLLYGDELDLHEDRALFPQEMAQSPISTLHHHVNHYVTQVRVAAGESRRSRRVHLAFSFPEDSDSYREDVELYAAGKLSRQAGRVNPALRSETDGQLEIDRMIHVKSETEAISGVRRKLPAGAHSQLLLELREQRILHRKELTAALEDKVKRQQRGVVTLHGGPDADFAGIFSWIEALTRCNDCEAIHLDFEIAAARDPADIVETIEELEQRIGPSPAEKGKPRQTLDELGHRSGSFRVWVFERVDLLLPEAKQWLQDELKATSAPVLAVLGSMEKFDPPLEEALDFELGPLSQHAIEESFMRNFGDDPKEAKERAEEFHLLAEGSPTKILAAIAVRLNRIKVNDE